MMDARLRLLVAASILTLAALPAAAQTKIVVGHVSRTTTMWPYFVAESKGMFAAEKLAVDNIVVNNVAAVTQQVVGGSLDIGNSTFEMAIQAVEGGAPISMIGATEIKYPFSMYAPKAINTAADLKGKPVMVPVPKNDIANFFEAWLKANGMALSDVDVIYNGSSTARFAALGSGGVAAVAVAPPLDFAAEAAGFHKLVDFGEFVKNYGFLGLVARKDYLSRNRPAVEAFARALSKATDWLYDPANKQEAVALLMRETKQDHDVSEKTYDYVVARLQAFSRGLKITEADFMAPLKAFQDMAVVKSSTAKMDQYVDLSFLK